MRMQWWAVALILGTITVTSKSFEPIDKHWVDTPVRINVTDEGQEIPEGLGYKVAISNGQRFDGSEACPHSASLSCLRWSMTVYGFDAPPSSTSTVFVQEGKFNSAESQILSWGIDGGARVSFFVRSDHWCKVTRRPNGIEVDSSRQDYSQVTLVKEYRDGTVLHRSEYALNIGNRLSLNLQPYASYVETERDVKLNTHNADSSCCRIVDYPINRTATGWKITCSPAWSIDYSVGSYLAVGVDRCATSMTLELQGWRMACPEFLRQARNGAPKWRFVEVANLESSICKFMLFVPASAIDMMTRKNCAIKLKSPGNPLVLHIIQERHSEEGSARANYGVLPKYRMDDSLFPDVMLETASSSTRK